jgi:branched-subunit amino acid aminotransferase/4-amino-4-deoxychorismate lyase
MQAWRWNGRAYEPCASLPIEDRGFRYGMSLFESIRVLQGRPLFLEPHLHRLQQACAQREFQVDPAALAAFGPLLAGEGGDSFARIYVTGGDGGPGDPATDCRVYVLMEERAPSPRTTYRLALSHDLYWPLFGGLKTANYWMNIDALQRARRKGHDEALLFNENAELVSSCMATVFLVQGGMVKTPSLACGARDGVVREWVLKQTGGRECSLFLQDVTRASEIFLANSWIGIVSVGVVETRELPEQKVAEQLRGAYEKLISGATA